MIFQEERYCKMFFHEGRRLVPKGMILPQGRPLVSRVKFFDRGRLSVPSVEGTKWILAYW
jgi:hypothetical protein